MYYMVFVVLRCCENEVLARLGYFDFLFFFLVDGISLELDLCRGEELC